MLVEDHRLRERRGHGSWPALVPPAWDRRSGTVRHADEKPGPGFSPSNRNPVKLSLAWRTCFSIYRGALGIVDRTLSAPFCERRLHIEIQPLATWPWGW